MNIPSVTCAMCRKRVDRLEWFDDHQTCERVIRAYCHGAMDEMRIDFRNNLSIANIRQIEESHGVAFDKPALLVA